MDKKLKKTILKNFKNLENTVLIDRPLSAKEWKKIIKIRSVNYKIRM